jgi:hypothetical protein
MGMTHETLQWKLFPFTLDERVKQWYTHNVGKVKGDWEELRNKFCLAFFLYLESLPCVKRFSTFVKTRRKP